MNKRVRVAIGIYSGLADIKLMPPIPVYLPMDEAQAS